MKPEQTAWVVVWSHYKDGLSFYGPFQTATLALEWATAKDAALSLDPKTPKDHQISWRVDTLVPSDPAQTTTALC